MLDKNVSVYEYHSRLKPLPAAGEEKMNNSEKDKAIDLLILELEGMIRVWENGWKVDRDVYISNAREAITKAKTKN